MDDLARITEDDQAQAFMREQRKRAAAIAGDVGAYRTALQDAGIAGELLDTLTQDFGGKWHALQTSVDTEYEVSLMYAEDDE